jgi:hypothetical protein
MASTASINSLELPLRNQKMQMQMNPTTFIQMVASTPTGKPKAIFDKRVLFSDEERVAYKAKETAKALEHCRRQREFIVAWQAYNGFY